MSKPTAVMVLERDANGEPERLADVDGALTKWLEDAMREHGLIGERLTTLPAPFRLVDGEWKRATELRRLK